MRIYIGSDHAGFKLKNELVPFLRGLGYEVIDKGPENLDEKDDYPDYIEPVSREVSENDDVKGIIIGGSGQGEAMTANRFKGVRAVVYYGGPKEIVELSRKDNDSNVLSLGARFIDDETAKGMAKLWLDTPFSGEERHARRIKKVDSV